MNYNERLFYSYPEWADVSDDDDMLEARDLARKRIDEALFDEHGAYWGYTGIDYRRSKKHIKVASVIDEVKCILAEIHINVSRFLDDWVMDGELDNSAHVIDLAVIYLARHFITQTKKEYHVGCTWQFSGEVIIYADNEDEAAEKAEDANVPHINSLECNPYDVDIDYITDPSEGT